MIRDIATGISAFGIAALIMSLLFLANTGNWQPAAVAIVAVILVHTFGQVFK